MTFNADLSELEFPCPKCGTKLKETIGRIKHDPNFVCSCGQKIVLDTSGLEPAFREVERGVAELVNEVNRKLKK